MNIQLDKKYTTRDGREVRVHAIDGPGDLPVVVSILNVDRWVLFRYPADGNNELQSSPSDADLIEIVPPYQFEVSFAGDVPDVGATFSVIRKMKNPQAPGLYALTLTEVK